MFRETVTRLRSAIDADPYSDAGAQAAAPELPIVTLAPAEPRPSGEPLQDARNQLTEGWTLYLPAGVDVTRLDQMRVRGTVYKVLGDPADWMGAGVVVQCERVEG